MHRTREAIASKVPEVTLAFWIIKVGATTLGETGGDALSMTMHLGYALSTAVFFAFFIVAVAVKWLIVHSPFGKALQAIRDNEQRAVSLGYEADRYKLLAFVLSAALAGLAGATKAMVLQFATLTDVSAGMSGEVGSISGNARAPAFDAALT